MPSFEERKPAQWVAEQLKVSDRLARDHQQRELESRLPGIGKIFSELITELPEITTEFPIAACVIRRGAEGDLEVVATSVNRTNEKHSSIAHAELLALEDAQVRSSDKHLTGSYLLSTLEPCVMCCGAAVNSGLEGVIYAVSHEDVAGKHASVGGIFKPYRTSPDSFNADSYLMQSGITVVNGFMREEALEAMTQGQR